MELVTGYKGEAHITAAQNGCLQAGIVGLNCYVLQTGKQLSASMPTNNLIRISDGDMVMFGRHVTIPKNTVEDLSVANGLAGVNRNDLVVCRYTKSSSTGIENAELMVLQGTATSGTPVDPEISAGNILNNSVTADFPLYRIKITGINASEPEKMFTVVPTLNMVQNQLALKLTADDIANNLTTTSQYMALSAYQGKVLNDNKVNVSDIANDLTTISSTKPLSAYQGKVLNDNKVNISDIVNNLTTSSSVKPLSAYQGKVLNDKVQNSTLVGTIQNALLNTGARKGISSGSYNSFSPEAAITGTLFNVATSGQITFNSTGKYYISLRADILNPSTDLTTGIVYAILRRMASGETAYSDVQTYCGVGANSREMVGTGFFINVDDINDKYLFSAYNTSSVTAYLYQGYIQAVRLGE